MNYYAALPPDILLQKTSGVLGVSSYLNKLQSDIGYIISQLFANSKQGFTQTPSDLSTLYQDAAGTTPVTAAGQPLGLVLDKSKGVLLGSELTPTAQTVIGWSTNNVTLSSDGTNLTLTTTAIGSPSARLAIPTVVGRLYKFTINQVAPDTTPNGNQVRLGTTASGIDIFQNVTMASGSSISMYFFAVSSTTYLSFGFGETAVGQVSTWTGISIKELSGNHSYQSTSSMRPLLQSTPQRIKYDGIDDKLTTTLPAQLTGCTVIRAIPNVGTQILTGQTIPTPYNDSTNHCGLIVINRALTAYETSLATQIFNKLSGV